MVTRTSQETSQERQKRRERSNLLAVAPSFERRGRAQGIEEALLLRLQILGQFEARLPDGNVLKLPTRKAEAMLGYLGVSSQRSYGRLALANIFWPRLDNRKAKHNLRQTISIIKNIFPKSMCPIIVDRQLISINNDLVSFDVDDFNKLFNNHNPILWTKALNYYRGDFLEGLDIRDHTLESWLFLERACLREQFLCLLTKLIEWCIETKQWLLATQYALRAISIDPLQEDVHRRLIWIYLKQNRTGAALQQYEKCVRTLKSELGIEPERRTHELYRMILFNRDSVRMPAHLDP